MSDERGPKVVLIFLDGVGIGRRGESNPLAAFASGPLAIFAGEESAPSGASLAVTDPRLGVEGRPQSASGQTTILTGRNAPMLLGYHKQGFPNRELRGLIAEHSIFRKIKVSRRTATFANCYTPGFFRDPPRWKSATTIAIETSETAHRTMDDLINGRAVFHDFTNASLRQSHPEIPLITPQAAAGNLISLCDGFDFVMYEHFITDKIGHAQDMAAAAVHLPLLGELLDTVADLIDCESTTLILTSDHGNIEDLSVRNHTLNDVPTIIWGRRRREAASMIKDLTDITPAILHLLTT